jgi:hypothetical protein
MVAFVYVGARIPGSTNAGCCTHSFDNRCHAVGDLRGVSCARRPRPGARGGLPGDRTRSRDEKAGEVTPFPGSVCTRDFHGGGCFSNCFRACRNTAVGESNSKLCNGPAAVRE